MPDDSVIPLASEKPKPPLWKRALAWTYIVGLYALLLGMAWLAMTLLSSVIKPGTAWDDRMYKSLEAAVLLIFPGRIAWVFIVRKVVTGSWLRMTEQEKARVAARRSARQCGTTKGGACGPTPQPWIKSVLNWAGHMAWNKNAGPWKRTLAWTTIVLYAAYVLFWIGFGLLCIGASFADNNTAKQQFLWILFGLVCLIYPALVIRSYFRRFQATGNVGVSREEFESVSTQRAEAENKRRQMPLRAKIVSYTIGLVFLGLMWIRATVYHSRYPHESWVTVAFFTIPLLYSIWRDFSKPKRSQSQGSDSFSSTQV